MKFWKITSSLRLNLHWSQTSLPLARLQKQNVLHISTPTLWMVKFCFVTKVEAYWVLLPGGETVRKMFAPSSCQHNRKCSDVTLSVIINPSEPKQNMSVLDLVYGTSYIWNFKVWWDQYICGWRNWAYILQPTVMQRFCHLVPSFLTSKNCNNWFIKSNRHQLAWSTCQTHCVSSLNWGAWVSQTWQLKRRCF